MTRLALLNAGGLLVSLAAAAPAERPAAAGADGADREARLLANAAAAYGELMRTPDAQIPEALRKGCRCIAVFPGVIKGALVWGARRGHGVVSCRVADSSWSAPLFMTLTGGSFGLQIGVEKSDLVLFIMNERSARALARSEFTLGARGGVAAGPLGRGAEGSTDIRLDAEIYSYAGSRGLFAGLSLEGARVHADRSANRRCYGRDVTAEEVLFDRRLDLPSAAAAFLAELPVPR